MTRGFFIPLSSYFSSSLLLLLLLLHLLSTAAREWHIANLYTNVQSPKKLPLVIYPKFNQCTNEDDLRMQLDWTSEEGNWSTILNQYLFYMASIPDSHAEELIVDVFATFRYVVLIGPFFFFACYFLFTTLALIFTIPFGAILFFIFGPVLFLVGKASFYIGRHLLICFESCSRTKERMVMPKSMRKLKSSYRQRNFRLPYFFRKTSDEQFRKEGWASSETENDENDNESDSSDEEEKQLVEELERKVRLRAFSTSLTMFRKNSGGGFFKSNQVQPEFHPNSNSDDHDEEKYNRNGIDIADPFGDEMTTDDGKMMEKPMSIILAPQRAKLVLNSIENKEMEKDKEVVQLEPKLGNPALVEVETSQIRNPVKKHKRKKMKHHLVGTQTTMESQFFADDPHPLQLPLTTASTTVGFRHHHRHHPHGHGHGHGHEHRVKGRPNAGALGRTKRRKSHGLDPDVRETRGNLNLNFNSHSHRHSKLHTHHNPVHAQDETYGKRKSHERGMSLMKTGTSILSQVLSRSSFGQSLRSEQRKSRSQSQTQARSHSHGQIPQIRIHSVSAQNINNIAPSRITSENGKIISRNASTSPTTGERHKKKRKHRKKTAKKRIIQTPSNLSRTASNTNISARNLPETTNVHAKPLKNRKIVKKHKKPR